MKPKLFRRYIEPAAVEAARADAMDSPESDAWIGRFDWTALRLMRQRQRRREPRTMPRRRTCK